jgi:putative methionine-R-sulfoxide reductase with GAF domain
VSVRDYPAIARSAAARLAPGAGDAERMQAAVDALWDGLSATGVSWCGFYLPAPDGRELLLGPRHPRPACSPIGLHGVCGRAFRERRALTVRDVRELGTDYVACDERDRSEAVLPLLDAGGACRAVLDLDSHEPGAFSEEDLAGLGMVLRAAGLIP